jgi:hypothetical protein
MKRTVTLLAFACALAPSLAAQKDLKPWTEWSKKDAEKVLNDSPWAQTQTVTDTSQMTYSPTPAGRTNESGERNQATSVKFYIRLFSARPIRQAMVRSMLLDMKGAPDPQMAERLNNFAEFESKDSIIVTVIYASRDGRDRGPAAQAFGSATTATLKNATYLERKDGKRVFLHEYVPPGKDGFGARFIFPREVDGQPVLSPESGDVRFVAEMQSAVKLDMKFKVSELMYNGKLEY